MPKIPRSSPRFPGSLKKSLRTCSQRSPRFPSHPQGSPDIPQEILKNSARPRRFPEHPGTSPTVLQTSLAKHGRHTCKREFLLKHALVQTRRQLPGLNHRRMRACMCVYSVWLAGRARRAIPALLFNARSCNNLLWGPVLLAKHRRRTCKRAFLLKCTLVQTRRQLPGLNHRRIRACMCVFGVWLAGRAATGNSGAAFHYQERQQLALGARPAGQTP